MLSTHSIDAVFLLDIFSHSKIWTFIFLPLFWQMFRPKWKQTTNLKNETSKRFYFASFFFRLCILWTEKCATKQRINTWQNERIKLINTYHNDVFFWVKTQIFLDVWMLWNAVKPHNVFMINGKWCGKTGSVWKCDGKKTIGEWREFYAKLLTIPSIRTDERMGKTVAERWR